MTSEAKAELTLEAAAAGHAALLGAHPKSVQEVLRHVLRRYQPRGVKTLDLVARGDELRAAASASPTTIWVDGMRTTVSPLMVREISAGEQGIAGGLTPKQLSGSRQVSARGHFLYNGKGHEFERMVSSEKAQFRRNATMSRVGAHAEEQLVNAFEEVYDHMLQTATRRGGEDKDPVRYTIELGVDVSSSSCPQCATHMVRFLQRLRSDGQIVSFTARFARLYSGPEGRALVPTPSNRSRDLVGLFYQAAELKPATIAREHGPARTVPAAPSPGMSLPSGDDVGRLGLTILRDAGVSVEVLRSPGIVGPPDREEADRRRRADKLEKALKSVDTRLASLAPVSA